MNCVKVTLSHLQPAEINTELSNCNSDIDLILSNLITDINASIEKTSNINAFIGLLNPSINAEALRKSIDINVKCRVVCSLSQLDKFLKVTPENIQWITNDTGVYYDVESNVEWVIVVD